MKNNTLPLISFCLPVYNVEPFLSDCLQSILSQNLNEHNVDFEILCIDDCSTDKSYEFLLSQSKNIPQLRLLKNEVNSGVSFTRNRLIREANGKYIWFVDPDDMLIKGAVLPILTKSNHLSAHALLADYICIPETTSVNNNYYFEDGLTLSPYKSLPPANSLPKSENGKEMCAIWAGVFLRKFLIESNLTMNEQMIAFEDTLFYYDLFVKTDNVYKIDYPCYLYRQRTSSVMHDYKNETRNQKYFISIFNLYSAYQDYKNQGNPANDELLDYKIERMIFNMGLTLTVVRSKSFVKSQILTLKNKNIDFFGIFKQTLKKEGPKRFRIFAYLLPKKQVFYLRRFMIIKGKNLK